MKKLVLLIITLCCAFSALAEAPADKLTKEQKKAQKDSIKAAEMIGAHRKGGTIRLDGTVLNSDQRYMLLSDIDAVDFNPEWAKLRSKRNWGKGLIIGGGVLGVAGGVVAVYGLAEVVAGIFVVVFSLGYGSDQAGKLMSRGGITLGIGAGAALVGVGGIAAGIPILTKANKRMTEICNGYNGTVNRVEKELIFGSTNNGVGLAFNF